MDVLSLGIYVVDVLGRPIDQFPEKGKLALFDELEIHTGGCANNTALALARLGISAGAMGKIGTDAFGDLILQTLTDNGVNTAGMRQDADVSTSFTFVAIASDGERTFYHYIGANGKLCEVDIDWELIKTAKILHIAGALVMPSFDGDPDGERPPRGKGTRHNHLSRHSIRCHRKVDGDVSTVFATCRHFYAKHC